MHSETALERTARPSLDGRHNLAKLIKPPGEGTFPCTHGHREAFNLPFLRDLLHFLGRLVCENDDIT